MRNLLAAIVLAALMAPDDAGAGEVIAYPSVSLTTDEVRVLYLAEQQCLGNLKLVPVDYAAARTEFVAKLLQTDERKYVARWLRKSVRDGVAAPQLMGADAEVSAFVQSTPGAVG